MHAYCIVNFDKLPPKNYLFKYIEQIPIICITLLNPSISFPASSIIIAHPHLVLYRWSCTRTYEYMLFWTARRQKSFNYSIC